MSDIIRVKGIFTKRKVQSKKIKALAGMAKAKEKVVQAPIEKDDTPNEIKSLHVGRRLVEVTEIGNKMFCCVCNNVLSFMDIEHEKPIGLMSIWRVSCRSCGTCTMVPSGKMHKGYKESDNSMHADVNTKLLLGIIHAGIGLTAINKLLACLNMQPINSDLYKRYEREIGPVIENTAKESCLHAAHEERQLVLKNLEELCEELPDEISDEIFVNIKQYLIDTCPSENEATQSGTFDSTQDSSSPSSASISSQNRWQTLFHRVDFTSRIAAFDQMIGNVISIVVSYDMGWTKRGNGRSYDSLNGYGAIIGLLSKKVLDFRTRNRMCKMCEMGRSKSDHDCRLNFVGSAKAMEADVGAELINDSEILKTVGLSVRVLIGDEDSSTIAAVRRGNSQKIFKLADDNHLRKHFSNELYELRKTHKELHHQEVIPHLKRLFNYAVAQNKKKAAELAVVLRQIPDHVFGNHKDCQKWCTAENNHAIVLKSPALYKALTDVYFKYANNSEKFAVAASSQPNESLNNIMAHKAPKNVCHSKSESCDIRWASCVNTYNDGQSYLTTINEKVLVSPGDKTRAFTKREDEKKARRAAKAKLRSSKARRNLLTKIRHSKRKNKENKEGVQYRPNCGMEENWNDLVEVNNNSSSLEKSIDSDSDIVYFDLETSGFSNCADILQIACSCNDRKFAIYINPSKPIPSRVTEVNGMENKQGELFVHGQRVPTVPLKAALEKFLAFLQFSGKACLLVAHNVNFDSRMLLEGFRKTGMVNHFQFVISGFSDTLILLKKQFPARKGKGAFKLQKLAEDLLGDTSNHFHEASYDVNIMEKLVGKFIDTNDLFRTAKSFSEKINNAIESQKTASFALTLQLLKGTITDGMIKKIAEAGLCYDDMKGAYENKGVDGLTRLLSDKTNNNKPRVTKTVKILQSIVQYFDGL